MRAVYKYERCISQQICEMARVMAVVGVCRQATVVGSRGTAALESIGRHGKRQHEG
jgi:hypothetical protein